MEENKKVELNKDDLEKVNGGTINVFHEVPKHAEYWKYTCRDCGEVGVMLGLPSACSKYGSGNIGCEEYNPVLPD